MKRLPRVVATALLASGCASAPEVPPTPAAPPPIETSSVAPATAAPAPVAPPPAEQPAAPPGTPLPATLDLAQVEKTFTYHRRYFERVFNAHRQAQPKLGGTMLVSFSVNPDGSTQGARVVESNLADVAFEQAVLKQIEQMTFPPAAGATPVERFPLQFSAPAPAPAPAKK